MKMQNKLTAGRIGVVSWIFCYKRISYFEIFIF
jgi:hypothetical protein